VSNRSRLLTNSGDYRDDLDFFAETTPPSRRLNLANASREAGRRWVVKIASAVRVVDILSTTKST
jgi:hypothetical protein